VWALCCFLAALLLPSIGDYTGDKETTIERAYKYQADSDEIGPMHGSGRDERSKDSDRQRDKRRGEDGERNVGKQLHSKSSTDYGSENGSSKPLATFRIETSDEDYGKSDYKSRTERNSWRSSWLSGASDLNSTWSGGNENFVPNSLHRTKSHVRQSLRHYGRREGRLHTRQTREEHGKNRKTRSVTVSGRETTHVSIDPFENIPAGPLQIIISLDQQKLHLYSNGQHIADATIATGLPSHPTPTGVFSVIQKDRYHRSNIYSGAPMPYMQRITWSGIAIHQGNNVGHPASHGCIRMPEQFAARLWALHSLGARVVIARPELSPQEFADPHLFVRKERRLPPAPEDVVTAGIENIRIVQADAADKATDAAPPLIPFAGTGKVSGACVIDLPAAGNESLGAIAAASSASFAPVLTKESSNPVRDSAIDPDSEVVPLPRAKPAEFARDSLAPIAIFISRKTSRLYVRQRFSPLFDAPITIEHPEQPFGTHVFTAMEFLADGSTFRWNLISLPGELLRGSQDEQSSRTTHRGGSAAKSVLDLPPPEPHAVLARIEISPEVLSRVSAMMVPGSSLVVSDHDLGNETGRGTDFIVVTH